MVSYGIISCPLPIASEISKRRGPAYNIGFGERIKIPTFSSEFHLANLSSSDDGHAYVFKISTSPKIPMRDKLLTSK